MIQLKKTPKYPEFVPETSVPEVHKSVKVRTDFECFGEGSDDQAIYAFEVNFPDGQPP